MLNSVIFGEKLKLHRTNLGLTQQGVAEKIGVSSQAVSKWENGDCLPDCFNLKALGELYNISLDVLMETEKSSDIKAVSEKLEQIADEFIWTKQNRDYPNAHRDLGSDLWDMWKGIFFIEAGNKEVQKSAKSQGNLRICSEYGTKIWDDDGIACIVQSALKDKIGIISPCRLALAQTLCSDNGFKLISLLDCHNVISKEDVLQKSGIEKSDLNELLLDLVENQIIEFVSDLNGESGYKLHSHYSIVAYMIIAAVYTLSKPNCTVSEYITRCE